MMKNLRALFTVVHRTFGNKIRELDSQKLG